MKFLTPLGGALALIAGGASAWGPLSHMTFNCQAFFPSLTVAECLQQNPTFGVASDIPDTFGFGAFNITDDADYLCKNLTYVHDPVFGGEMTLLAMDERRRGVAGNGSFDAMALAVAFTGHIMGDLVGFNPARGALCTREAVACDATNILYMPEWGYMSSIDAFYYGFYGDTPGLGDPPLPSEDNLGPEAYAFLARSSQLYAAKNPKFAPFSAEAARQCVAYWRGNMAYVYDRSKYFASGGAAGKQALLSELAWFAPKGTADIATYLASQAQCAARTVAYHHAALMASKDPAGAVKDAVAFVNGLYAAGECTDGRTF